MCPGKGNPDTNFLPRGIQVLVDLSRAWQEAELEVRQHPLMFSMWSMTSWESGHLGLLPIANMNWVRGGSELSHH